MKEFLARLLCAMGLPLWARRKNRRKLLILMYHGVVPRPLSPACWHQLDLPAFRRQLAWVKRKYTVLMLSEALEWMRLGTLPPRACAITFDDGLDNVRTAALPVLLERNVPATVFLVTGPMGTAEALWPDRLYLAFARTVGTKVDLSPLRLSMRSLGTPRDRALAYADAVRALKALPKAEKDVRLHQLLGALGEQQPVDPGPFRLLSWDGAREMTQTGLVELGGHSVHHEILSRLPDGEVAAEVCPSHLSILDKTGVEPVVFAYPNGRAADFDDRARAAVEHLGIRYAVSTIAGRNDAETDPLALRRIGVGSDLSFARFKLLASGALDFRSR